MGRKRPRNRPVTKPAKRHAVETDLQTVSPADYVTVGAFRYVLPYMYEFRMNYKPRWHGETVQDVFCSEFAHADDEYWKTEIREGRVRHNGKNVRGEAVTPGTTWCEGMETIHVVHRHESAILSADIPIVYNDKSFVVVSKPHSMPIHPCGTYRRNCLLFLLAAQYNMHNLHVVHRLDKETSGVVILAKTPSAAASFSDDLRDRKMHKTYVAEVRGDFGADVVTCNNAMAWDARALRSSVDVDGRDAETTFRRLSYNSKKDTSIVECEPQTGRTHQIRVHLAHLGHSIINDGLYGETEWSARASAAVAGADAPSALSLADRNLDASGSIRRAGKSLSCRNCPQVTNLKNVESQAMFIHLHALKYKSDQWSYEVPLPEWATTEPSRTNPKVSSCAIA